MNATPTVTPVHLPLDRVALCLDCERCFDIGGDSCPACGSVMWVLVARFLTRR